MRILMSLMALMMTFVMQAQQANPVVEKEGELIKATYFHDNGQIAQVGYFLNGELHGDWKMFDEQGNKLAVGQYDNGSKTGKWFIWDDKGLKEVDFTDNQVAHVVQWNNGEAMVLNNR